MRNTFTRGAWGDHSRAIQLLEKLTTNYAEQAPLDAWLRLAHYYWWMLGKNKEKLLEAVEIYQKLLGKYPEKRPEIWRELAQVYKRLGQPKMMIEAQKNAFELFKKRGTDHNNLVRYLIDMAHSYRWINFDEHILCYQRAVHEYPKANRNLIAQCYLEMGQSYSAAWDPKVAMKYLKKVIMEFKDVRDKKIIFNALLFMGDTFKKMPVADRFKKAVAKYDEARKFAVENKIQGAAQAILRAAETWFVNLKDPKSAEPLYKEIIQRYPGARKNIIEQARKRLKVIKLSP